MKKMEWDDQMRDLKAIEQVHVLPEDRLRGWEGQIRHLKAIDQVHVRTGDR